MPELCIMDIGTGFRSCREKIGSSKHESGEKLYETFLSMSHMLFPKQLSERIPSPLSVKAKQLRGKASVATLQDCFAFIAAQHKVLSPA